MIDNVVEQNEKWMHDPVFLKLSKEVKLLLSFCNVFSVSFPFQVIANVFS